METVYVVGIIVLGVVVVIVVWLLRARLKSAEMRASLKERELSGKLDAFSPKTVPPPTTSGRQPSVDVSGNVIVGSGIIRVWRSSVRAARNWLLGKRPTIEIKEPPPKKDRRR
jgi:hypothetical protein